MQGVTAQSPETEPEPYHNLVLAAACLRDAGSNRILGDLERDLRGRLQRELETPVARGTWGAMRTLFTRGMRRLAEKKASDHAGFSFVFKARRQAHSRTM